MKQPQASKLSLNRCYWTYFHQRFQMNCDNNSSGGRIRRKSCWFLVFWVCSEGGPGGVLRHP
jgi:hypothetical protein